MRGFSRALVLAVAFAVQDLELVASELNSFCEGKHPMFPGLANHIAEVFGTARTHVEF